MIPHRKFGTLHISLLDRPINSLVLVEYSFGTFWRPFARNAERDFHAALDQIMKRLQHLQEQLISARGGDGAMKGKVCGDR